MLDLSTMSEFSGSPGKPRIFSGAAAASSASAWHQTSGDGSPLSASHPAKHAVQGRSGVKHNNDALLMVIATSESVKHTSVQHSEALLQHEKPKVHSVTYRVKLCVVSPSV